MRIRKYLWLLSSLLLFSLNDGRAQVNLVPNPDFESYSSCPSFHSQITLATPWFQPYSGGSSTDYFHICTTYSGVGIPNNGFGYQYAHSGSGYSGICLGALNGSNEPREYLEVELDSPLISGKKYCLSFYISLGNYAMKSTDAIGALFTNQYFIYFSPAWGVISASPQIENVNGNILQDTLNWMLFEGSFIATGGEKFMTIGNFRNDSSCAISINTQGIINVTYYYIDDVSVILCDSTTGTEEITDNDVTISPNPASDKIKIALAYSFQKEARLKLVTSVGKTIIETDFRDEIDVGTLPDGIYFLSIETKKGKVIKKVIVD